MARQNPMPDDITTANKHTAITLEGIFVTVICRRE